MYEFQEVEDLNMVQAPANNDEKNVRYIDLHENDSLITSESVCMFSLYQMRQHGYVTIVSVSVHVCICVCMYVCM
jgi:hypothetical protein